MATCPECEAKIVRTDTKKKGVFTWKHETPNPACAYMFGTSRERKQNGGEKGTQRTEEKKGDDNDNKPEPGKAEPAKPGKRDIPEPKPEPEPGKSGTGYAYGVY